MCLVGSCSCACVSGKHGPNRLSSFLDIHAAVMSRYIDEAFVLEDELVIDPLGDNVIEISGLIRCAGGVVITVYKYIDIVRQEPEVWVRTSAYSYNASLAGRGNIFRYCSPHLDHNKFHHRHNFDVFAGDVTGTVAQIDGDWPTLGDVIGELRCWTSEHHSRLEW